MLCRSPAKLLSVSPSQPGTFEDSCVLATVVKTEGSTYQKSGAQMMLHRDGRQEGILTGACAEGPILEAAQNVWTTQKPLLRTLDSYSTEDLLFGLGTGCQGRQTLLLEFAATRSSPLFLRKSSKKTVSAIVIRSRHEAQIGQRLYLSSGSPTPVFSSIDSELLPQLTEIAESVLKQEQSAVHSLSLSSGDEVEVSVLFQKPAPVLHVFGAGADAIAIYQLAAWMQWTVHVYEHRSIYLKKETFPAAELHPKYEVDLSPFGDCKKLALVMTHNFMHDLLILEKLVDEPFTYIGLLGPKKRGQNLLSKLQTSIPSNTLYFPVGLTLGGRSPHEIALSVIAELQGVCEGKSLGHWRDV